MQPGMILLCVYDGVNMAIAIAHDGGRRGEQRPGGGQRGPAQSGGRQPVFAPKNGNTIVINGALQTIPAGGIVLAPTGLQANTLYYIYVTMNPA